jgi:hypothetical protein
MFSLERRSVGVAVFFGFNFEPQAIRRAARKRPWTERFRLVLGSTAKSTWLCRAATCRVEGQWRSGIPNVWVASCACQLLKC